jgi:hypothetical protein
LIGLAALKNLAPQCTESHFPHSLDVASRKLQKLGTKLLRVWILMHHLAFESNLAHFPQSGPRASMTLWFKADLEKLPAKSPGRVGATNADWGEPL